MGFRISIDRIFFFFFFYLDILTGLYREKCIEIYVFSFNKPNFDAKYGDISIFYKLFHRICEEGRG